MSSYISATNDSLFGTQLATSTASTTPPASTPNRSNLTNPQPNLAGNLANTLQRSDIAGNSTKRESSVLFGLSQRSNESNQARPAPRSSSPTPAPSRSRNLYRATNTGTRAGSLVDRSAKSVLVRHSPPSPEAKASAGPSRPASAPRSSGSSLGIPKPASAVVKGAQNLANSSKSETANPVKQLSQRAERFPQNQGFHAEFIETGPTCHRPDSAQSAAIHPGSEFSGLTKT